MSPRRAGIFLAAVLTLTAGATALVRAAAYPFVFGQSAVQEAPAGAYDAVLQACHSANPYFAAARFVWSPQRPSDRSALIAVHDTNSTDERWDEEDQVSLAQHAQIGSVNGVAYDWLRHRVYVAGYHRILSAFGPGGPGAIYQVDLESGEVKEFAQIPGGHDHHSDALGDLAARPWVGRTSLGDIDVDATASTLFVTNLEDRRIYRFSLPEGRALGSFPHGAVAESWAPNARPFGLGVHDGRLYHGVVDTRQDSSLPGSLAAYVYRSRADGSDMRQVLRAELAYSRSVPWRSWIDPSEPGDPSPAQPYVADIEFRENGDLVLGLADRTRDMGVSGPANGELLPAHRLREDEWAVADGARDYYADPVKSSQAPLGALASMPGLDVLVAAMEFSPAAGGIVWYDNGTGRRYQPVDGHEWLYGDSPPIGDLEALCPPGRPHVYLPVTLRGTCPAPATADVVLVMDMSSSMSRSTPEGTSKAEAAVHAAQDLVDLVAKSDVAARLAVVGFNEQAWIEAPLGSSAAAHTALGRLTAQVTEGTRLDLALSTAHSVVATRAPAGNRRATVVLLTDGLPNHVPPAEDGSVEITILRMASQLKAAGAAVYTVGFGEPGDYSPQLLRAIASDPKMFHAEVSADGLGRLFAGIAALVGCP